jgi:translocation and assembly module TamA
VEPRTANTQDAPRLDPRAGAVAVATFLAAAALAQPVDAELTIEGAEGPPRNNVLTYLNLDEEPCTAPAWRIEQQFRAAPGRIAEALEVYGYYEPKIEPSLRFDEDCWHATFSIELGEPVLIRSATVSVSGEAQNDPDFTAALAEANLTSGSLLNHVAYEVLKRRWADLARERGYADARLVENRIDVYPEEHAADIALEFDSGVRYAFGRTELVQDVLTDELARSYVTFREGEPFDARRLTEVYGELADSGYFRTIDVRPLEPEADTRKIPVEIALTSAARRQISYGVGFSTDTGPRFRFGRNNRRFNERGHQFGVNAQLSPVISELTANYRLPLNGTRSEWLSLDAGIERENTDTADSQQLEFGVRRVLERRGSWTRTQMLSLRVEDFTVADQTGRSQLLMPGIDWTRIRADNSIRPNRGSRVSLEVRGASDAVISDTSFVQTIARGKWIWSLPRGGRFLVRGDVGATAKSAFDELPASVRFFAGGDNSVRGYDFEALGPVDDTGAIVGGSSLATGSFEFEQPLRARWSMAFFVDSGNAFEGSHIDAKTGAGLGGRWLSPLGPIRIDLAHPFDDEANSWRLHISLGPDL